MAEVAKNRRAPPAPPINRKSWARLRVPSPPMTLASPRTSSAGSSGWARSNATRGWAWMLRTLAPYPTVVEVQMVASSGISRAPTGEIEGAPQGVTVTRSHCRNRSTPLNSWRASE